MYSKKKLIMAVIALVVIVIIIIAVTASSSIKNDPTKILTEYFSYLQNRRI